MHLPILIIVSTAFLAALLTIKTLLPRLKERGIVGEDVHKPNKPHIPEMGGLVIGSGFTAGILIMVGLCRFTPLLESINLPSVFAVGFTVLIISILGIIDDLLHVRQIIKAMIPLVAALPLMAIKAGKSLMSLPVVGKVEFGLIYPLVLVPIGVTGAANAVNMLAGFNGLEVGLGIVVVGTLGFIAWLTSSMGALLILASAFGALLITLYYNWYPAKLMIGDVGTLSIGAIIASAVIIGDFEYGGVIAIIPYFIDFILKAANRFPKSFGEYRDGKLYCPKGRPVGLAQLVMKLSGGITERNLVLVLIGIEVIFGVLAISYYL